MRIKDLKRILSEIEDDDAHIFVSSDEELNTLFTKWEITKLEDNNGFVIFGLSGTEFEL